MGTLLNPNYATTRPQQAGMYYARKRRRARRIIQSLTPWSAGLSVTQGHYVSYLDNAYQALSSGTTGSTPPTNYSGRQSDGTITWQYVDPASLSKYLFTGAPTP